jgi:hypothetical protein
MEGNYRVATVSSIIWAVPIIFVMMELRYLAQYAIMLMEIMINFAAVVTMTSALSQILAMKLP